MDNASRRFCYLEDPDILIELVETHKVPILKNWLVHGFTKTRPRKAFTMDD
jgi:hypothetical protein